MTQNPKTERAEGQRLQACLKTLLRQLDEAEAESWGADIFRRLKGSALAVQHDLEAGLPASAATVTRLGALGAELSLQEWANVWPAAEEYTAAITETLKAVEAFRSQTRQRL